MGEDKLFCENCGSEEDFIKEWDEYESFSVVCDQEGEIDDEDMAEERDYNYRHGGGSINNEKYLCNNCNKEVYFMDEDEILESKVFHTDKNNKWNEKELPQEERNEELMKEWVAKQL